MKKWGILIATIVERRPQLNALHYELTRQIEICGLKDQIEIITLSDNKEMSIGRKRNLLLQEALVKGCEYINFMDDDDMPYPYYIKSIYDLLNGGVDCIGLMISMTTNGTRPQTCCHSLKYLKWDEKKDGYDYVRNVTHFNPVKLSLAIKVGFPDLRFGEDKVYSDALTRLCSTEKFIPRPILHYRYSNRIPHNKKYGVK